MNGPQTSASEPRSGSIVLGGYPWLARMIDKARLEAAGQIEPFDLEYPCPMDQRLLAQFKMDGRSFQQIVVSAPNDQAILEALKTHGVSIQPS
jgi:hypothetical protein